MNRIRFKLSCFGPGEVAVVSLLGTTSLRETDRAPARLRLTAERSDEDPEAGVPLSLPFEVTNTGDVLARDVEVHLELQGSEAEVVGRRAYLYDSLEGTRRGEFIVVPRRPGGLNVELIAGSANSNQPAVSLRGKAGTRTKTSAAVASPWLAVAVITVIAGVVVMIFRRRRSA